MANIVTNTLDDKLCEIQKQAMIKRMNREKLEEIDVYCLLCMKPDYRQCPLYTPLEQQYNCAR